MNDKQIVVSQLKQMKAKLEAELKGINAALSAFGATVSVHKGKGKTRASGTARPRPQAAIDARAVKRGKASPEQIERHNKRLMEKAKAGGQPQEYAGASLSQSAS